MHRAKHKTNKDWIKHRGDMLIYWLFMNLPMPVEKYPCCLEATEHQRKQSVWFVGEEKMWEEVGMSEGQWRLSSLGINTYGNTAIVANFT